MAQVQVFGGERGTSRLGIKVQSTARPDLPLVDDFPHHCSGFVQVRWEFIDVPANELVTLVGIERAEHSGGTRHADLVLVGVSGQVRVVTFQIELEVIGQVVGLQECDRRGSIEVVLVRRRFLGLGFDEELCVQADLLGVVHAHVEEAGDVILFALEIGVPQILVSFAPAPEDVIFRAQSLRDFQRVLELAG